jgi:hypothetical protein
VENSALKDQLDKILDMQQSQVDHSTQLYDQKSESFAQRFRKQTKQNEEDLNIIKVQYGEIQDKYLNEIKTLDHDNARLKEKRLIVERRRNTEQQAFQGDI